MTEMPVPDLEIPDRDAALAWLAERAHENLGTEVALRRATAAHGPPAVGRRQVRGAAPLAGGSSAGWDAAVARRADGGLAGVSVVSPAGQWHLETDSAAATAELVAHVAGTAGTARAGHWPAKVTASGTVKTWLRPLLAERGVCPTREHDLPAMVCRQPPGGDGGRWEVPADRPSLERYQLLYNEERRTTTVADWESALRRPAIAVLEEEGRIVAVVKRTADTEHYATIGGTWTDPVVRRRGLARRLTAFIVGELLAERSAVHLIVDDDNAAAIGLYRSLGFKEVGICYMAYLP